MGMVSMSKLGKASAGRGEYYVAQCVRGRDDYYTGSPGEPPGRWLGESAEAYGVEAGAVVATEDFRQMLRGFSPDGEALVRKAGEQHVAGFDFTFSADKSVSIAWATATPERRALLAQAHDEAVREAVQFLERRAAWTRLGTDGVDSVQLDGVLAAGFQHATSRELDPQLHTHVIVANLARLPDGSGWRTLDGQRLYEWQRAVGAAYRASLGAKLRELGLPVVVEGDRMRIAGIPESLVRHYSKRRAQIEQHLAESGEIGPGAAEVAALETRATKEPQLSRAELYERWQRECSELGFGADEAEALWERTQREPVELPSDDELLASLTEQASTVSEADIYRAVLGGGAGRLTLAEGEAHVERLMKSDQIVRLVGGDERVRYSTREMIRLERRMADAAESRRGEGRHVVAPEHVESAIATRSMGKQQTAAFRHAVESTDGVVAIQGGAGVGKSYLAGAAREAWEAGGYRVRGCALAGKAAAGLQDDAGIKSQTIHSLLMALDEGREQLAARDVIVMDEAGMTGSRLMSRLLDHTQAAKAKVVLIGDARQLQPIDAGGAFRALSARLGAVEVTETIRQRQTWARDAVEVFAQGEVAQALGQYAERGLLRIDETRESAMRRLVSDWAASADFDDLKNHIMLAGTRREVATMNELAREAARAAGALGDETVVSTEGGDLALAVGERVKFGKNSKLLGVMNGDFGYIERIDGEGAEAAIEARLDSGRRVCFGVAEYAHINRGWASTTHSAQGVTSETAHVLGGGSMASRELLHVQMSRARSDTRLYLEREGVDDALEAAPPTEKMQALAESLVAPPEALESFTACRRWLDANSGRELGLDGDREHELLRQIPQAVFRMSQSRQKDSTLDYAEALPQRDRSAPDLPADPAQVSDLTARHHQPPAPGQPDPAEQPAEAQQPRQRLRRGLSI